jgi:hypothetical protein
MTIRQYIRRRWVITIWTAGAALLAILYLARSQPPRQQLVIGEFCLVALMACVGAQALAMQWLKCPRCAIPLGWAGTQAAFGMGKQADACPHCKVGFDAPVDRLGSAV